MDSTRERVLYVNPMVSARLAALRYEELGRVDNGVWVACPDETVNVLAQNNPPVFLYFDRVAYESGVADLSGPQTQEVIRRRRDRFASDAKAYLMSWLYGLESISLEAGLQIWPPAAPQILKSLSLLQYLAGLQRYQTIPAKAMAVTVLEAEALLLATVRSALDSPIFAGTAESSVLTQHFNHRITWATALRRTVAVLGVPQFADAMPFADPARGAFVHPADAKFEQELAKAGEPAVRWQDGLVFALAERRIAAMREQKFTVDILYADAGDYYDSVEALTKAQLYRDFGARLKRSAAEARRDYVSHIDRLHLHQILMKRELGGRADARQACASSGMGNFLPEEIALLAQSLSRSRSFSRSEGLHQMDARTLYPVAEAMVNGDSKLFGSIASRYWPAIAPNFTEIEKFKNDGEISRT